MKQEYPHYREMVVYQSVEDFIPKFTQGQRGERFLAQPVTAEALSNWMNRTIDLHVTIGRFRDYIQQGRPWDDEAEVLWRKAAEF